MFKAIISATFLTAAITAASGGAQATLTTFTDQTAFLNAVGTSGYLTFFEGFEDAADWGTVRTSLASGVNAAASITASGITWSSSVGSDITTSSGAARGGNWGLYSFPLGVPFAGPAYRSDRFGGASVTKLYAVGGFIRTNTPFAAADLYIDGKATGAGNGIVLGTTSQFYGAIDTAGFNSFEIIELDGEAGDLKYIFGDDFAFGVSSSMVPVPPALALGLAAFALLAAAGRQRPKG